jgi:hypothetical protein
MIYPLMYLYGIYVAYPWIFKFLDIPSFLKPDLAAGPPACCWPGPGSHSMCPRVWVIKSVLFHAPPWQLCHHDGEKTADKKLNPPPAANLHPSLLLVPVAPVVTAAAAAAVSWMMGVFQFS